MYRHSSEVAEEHRCVGFASDWYACGFYTVGQLRHNYS